MWMTPNLDGPNETDEEREERWARERQQALREHQERCRVARAKIDARRAEWQGADFERLVMACLRELLEEKAGRDATMSAESGVLGVHPGFEAYPYAQDSTLLHDELARRLKGGDANE